MEGTGCTMSGKQSGNIINMGLKIKFIISDPKKIIEEPNKDDIKWFIMMLLISVKNWKYHKHLEIGNDKRNYGSAAR